MPKKTPEKKVTVTSYAQLALPHLQHAIERNRRVMKKISDRLVRDVTAGKSLLVFGSGHSGIFPLELYHRAGGASFVIPVVAEYLLPTAGPSVVRTLERTAGAATAILNRCEPVRGEMIWIASQSGINGAVVDFALEAKKRGLHTVAFTSVAHSSAVASRHSSGKRLFEVCDDVVDFGGFKGDAAVRISPELSAGPLSTLTSVLLGHSILVAACAELEKRGKSCIYTSVNTPEGEARNKGLEQIARKRDYLLR
jgi:uncharacterized phosphosugar-binding protein